MIRPAAPDDAALLARVAAETFPLACPPHTLPESIAAFIAANLSEASFEGYLADPDRALFVAEADSLGSGEAAGYTMVVFGEPADPDVAAAVNVRPTAELSKVYVREGFHGAGLAARLVAASVEAARSRGAASVWLGVNQLNARANRFYEKQGFALVGTKRFLVGERYEDDFVRLLAL
jgi:ribosomal protein S18 acetylase RimI-like enzyme